MSGDLDLAAVQAVVTDMDGVLWRGGEMLPGVAELFSFLAEREVPIVLATNNAAAEPEAVTRRLAAAGAVVQPEQVITSALVAADFLRADHPPGTPTYVIGGPALRRALTDAGFAVVPDAASAAELVVAGIDFDLTYDKLAHAALHIQRGARFVGTNGDLTYPAEDGLRPGAGTILAALQACTGRAPVTVGKPQRAMFDAAVARLGRPAERTVMLGDRLDTDVLGARRAGLRSVLVTTGVDVAAGERFRRARPDLVVSGLPELLALWRRARRR